MTSKSGRRCQRCGHSYTSWTHRKSCRGMSRGEHLTKNRSRRATRAASRSCSKPDWGRILAAGPVNSAYYDRFLQPSSDCSEGYVLSN